MRLIPVFRLLRLGISLLLLMTSACSFTAVPSTPTPAGPPPQRLAFDSDGGIYSINADGTNLTQLVKRGGWPFWSPDGKFMVFGNGQIYVVSVSGGKPSIMVKDVFSGHSISSFAWSPDEKQIAIATSNNGDGSLYVTDVEHTATGWVSGTVKKLKINMDGQTLAWSPDSKYLAFDYRSVFFNYSHVGLIDMSTGESMNIPSGNYHPTWSPDGKYVALMSQQGDDNNTAEILSFNVVNLIRDKLIKPAKLTQNNYADSAPCWSPDGKQIVFVSNRDGNNEIYVMNADGSHQTRLTNDPALDFYPVWSPDSRQIAFVSERNGNYDIYVINADGSHLLRLTNNDSDNLFPTWQPQP